MASTFGIFTMPSQPVISAVAGVVSHLGFFIHGEHHRKGPVLLKLSVTIPFVILFLESVLASDSLGQAATATALIVASYAVSFWASVLVYRVALHRLRAFPGPFMAKSSKLWHVAKAAKSDNYQQLERLHKQYGDFVRIGPNELSICNPEALGALYGPGTKCTKSPWYDILLPTVSLHTTRNKAAHDKRRRIWDHAFSAKALRNYEGRVEKYAEQLEEQIRASSGKAIDASLWFEYYSFDVMGDLSYGRPFDMLKSGGSHFAIDLLKEGISMVGPLSPIPWVFPLATAIPGMLHSWNTLISWAAEQMERRVKDYKVDTHMPDVTSWLIDASRRSNSLERDKNWLNGDALLLIVAGSDTTSATLTFLFYHLAKDPAQVAKLREELKGIDSAFNHKALGSLNHLNAIINETLRLHHPVPSGLQRLTPPEGLTVANRYIPGGVTVVVPIHALQRNESYFERADEFIPERWYAEPQMVKDKRAFAPFSIGPYSCIGKQLALMELRTVVALLVKNFDIGFAEGENGVGVLEDAKDSFTLTPGKLKLVFTPCAC